MAELIKPEIIEARYQDGMHCIIVRPNGYRRDISVDFDPRSESFDEKLAKAGHTSGSGLAWVEFYKKPIITIRHPESVLPEDVCDDFAHPRTLQLDSDNTIPGADSQYVIGEDGEKYIFRTAEQILGAGALSTHMTEWLFTLSSKSKMWSDNLDPFLPYLPGSPSSPFQMK